MKYDSIFDVIGHIMVGPSSSHTFGAGRIGYIAQLILGGPPVRCEIFLHGSFAETYRGHGTDKALLAGILGIPPDDERLRDAFKIAREKNIKYSFKKVDLGADYHPNTVKIILYSKDDKLVIIGSSIGGGNIIIEEIDGMEAGFNGDKATLITIHEDKVGVVAKITSLISSFDLNIEAMRVSRDIRTNRALCWIELNYFIPEELVKELEKLNEVEKVRVLNV